jgi:hypothetical protein
MAKKFVWTPAAIEATVRVNNLTINLEAIKVKAAQAKQDWRDLFQVEVQVVVKEIFEAARKENASRGGKALWAKIRSSNN